MRNVYVLVAHAVYDQGIYGVFTTEQRAAEHAEGLLDESDYHHGMRVQEVSLDEGLIADKVLFGWTGGVNRFNRVRPTVLLERKEEQDA